MLGAFRVWCGGTLLRVDTPEELFEAYAVIIAEHSQRCYCYTVLSRLYATYVQLTLSWRISLRLDLFIKTKDYIFGVIIHSNFGVFVFIVYF